MNNFKFVLLLLFGILSVLIFLLLRVYKGGIPGVISKTVASLFFVLSGLLASLFSPNHFDIKSMIVVGLMFGMLGDIWLDLKVTYTKDLKPWLYSGFISFMLGHIFYITAIVLSSKMNAEFVLLSIISGIALGYITISLENAFNLKYGPYKKITFIYASILFCTASTSLMACLISGFENTIFLFFFLGSIFFLVSDLILSNTYFGLKSNDGPIWIVSNHVTYYIAQYLIASSILFL